MNAYSLIWRIPVGLAAGLLLTMTAACSRPVEGTGRGEAAEPALMVKVVKPRREPIARNIALSASVEAYETAALYAKVAGYLSDITVDIGDHVDEGQVLATLEIREMQPQYAQAESELREREAELARAEASAKLQELVLDRSRGLKSRDAITQQDLDEARARRDAGAAEVALARARRQSAQGRLGELEKMMEYGVLKAPFDGVVTRRFIDRGTLVQSATSSKDVSPIITVASADTVRVFVQIPERDVRFIDRGDPVVLELSAFQGKTFAGRITRFAGALDPGSRSMRAEADFPNPAGEILPGMYGTLTISVETKEKALTLPQAAIQRRKKEATALVVRDGRAVRRQVRTGVTAGSRVEILAGVEEADRVIVAAPAGLADGAEVKVVAADG